MRSPALAPRSTPARAGRCCATPTAERFPNEVERIVGEVARVLSLSANLGIHAHNDTANAVANSLAAIRAGARQVQGTLNGLGERCGNANLVSLIPTLALKPDLNGTFRDRRDGRGFARDHAPLASLRRDCSTAPRTGTRPMSVRRPSPPRPAFTPPPSAKDPRTYEHVAPDSVGNAARRAGLGSGWALESCE